MADPKQVIVIRRDLGMRRGKEISQGAHASMAWLARRVASCDFLHVAPDTRSSVVKLSKVELAWLQGLFTKVTLQVESEADLRGLYERAKAAGLEAHLIEDSGKTEFHGQKTATALAIGPDMPDKIDSITGGLKLY